MSCRGADLNEKKRKKKKLSKEKSPVQAYGYPHLDVKSSEGCLSIPVSTESPGFILDHVVLRLGHISFLREETSCS